MIFTPLLNNITLLVALSVVHSFLIRWFKHNSFRFRILSGFLYGAVAIVGMLNAVPLAEGVFFDGRSVVLSVAGVFGGPVPAAIAAGVAGAYRIYSGGDGVVMGVLVILTSGLFGTGLYFFRRQYQWASKGRSFLALGFLVHVAMLTYSVALPGPLTFEVARIIFLPVMTIYPLSTLLLCLLFRGAESQESLISQLSASEERFRQVFENSAAVHMLIDPDTGKIVDVNRRAVSFYGWPQERLTGMNVREINAMDRKTHEEEMQAVLRGEKTVFNLHHQIASGEVRDVEVHAGPVAVGDKKLLFTIVHDITDSKRNQEELARERILMRTVIDNIPDAVYVKDPQLRKVLANKAELEILGRTEEEVIGKTDRELYPPEEAEQFEEDDLKVLRRGETILNREERIVSPNGEVHWLLTSKTPLRNEQGEVVGLVGIGRNINERIQALEELERVKEEAVAANRAKSEFLANMSHEIRTPMNAILGFSEALYHRLTSPENKKMLSSVVSSGNLLLGLLNDILDLSKIEAGMLEITPHPVNLRRHLEDIRLLFEQKAGAKGLTLKLQSHENFPETLLLDEIRIKQVVFNLVGNAVKFTHKGSIEIGVDFAGKEDNKGALRIWVKDTGIGIPPDQQEQIFKPFYQQSGQSDRQYGGTGLGLPISQRLIEKMNGEILLESEVGKGSTFTVVLPGVEVTRKPAPALAHSDNKGAIRFGEATILIVDDAPANIEMLEVNMELLGLKTLTAESGEKALELLKDHRPDLALIDILMPGMDGFGLAKAIRRQPEHKAMPLVAFTALMNETGKIEHSGLFDSHLYKPVSRKSLLDVLSKFLKHRIEIQDPGPATTREEATRAAEGAIPLPKEKMEKLPELLEKLRSDFLPRWESVKDQWVLFKIEAFAEELADLAGDHGVARLAAYAGKLKHQADNLDLEALRDTMGGFPALVGEIEALAADPSE